LRPFANVSKVLFDVVLVRVYIHQTSQRCPNSVANADDKLSYTMQYNNNYVLYQLLHDRYNNSIHNVRKRSHDRPLPNKTGQLSECTFLIRMLFKDVY